MDPMEVIKPSRSPWRAPAFIVFRNGKPALFGFTQLEMSDGSKEYTAFRSHRGLYQFKRLPFGYRNGPSVFQRVMQDVLSPYLWIFALVYIDNIVIFSKSFDEHLIHIGKVLKSVKTSGITLSPVKCHFGF